MAWVTILTPPPHSKELLVIWAVLLMQNVPLDAVLPFDLHTAILGLILSAVQPKKQHPQQTVAEAIFETYDRTSTVMVTETGLKIKENSTTVWSA